MNLQFGFVKKPPSGDTQISLAKKGPILGLKGICIANRQVLFFLTKFLETLWSNGQYHSAVARGSTSPSQTNIVDFDTNPRATALWHRLRP